MFNPRERILLTALRLFAQDGYEAVSVGQIAGALAVPPVSVPPQKSESV